MTITLSPEQEQLLSEVVEAGLAGTPEEAIDKAVRDLHSAAKFAEGALPLRKQVNNLSDLLLKSPFFEANLDLERSQDYPRRVDVG